MEITEYQEEVKRTMFNEKQLSPKSFYEEQIKCYTFGIVGETLEMVHVYGNYCRFITNPQNICSDTCLKGRDKIILVIDKLRQVLSIEIGDIFWYIAALCNVMNKPFKYNYHWGNGISNDHTIYGSFVLLNKACEITEYVKKGFYHNHGIDEEKFYKMLISYFMMLTRFTERDFVFTSEEIFKKNIGKLRKRYPKNFNFNDSINREENKKDNETEITDKDRLDFLQILLECSDYSQKCILRSSGTGRGFRLHETLRKDGVNDVRLAIDNYMKKGEIK